MSTQIITPTYHGILDYAAAVALVGLPIMLQLDRDSNLVYWFSIGAGFGLVIYSLVTNYALSLLKAISYQTHLMLDAIASLAFITLALTHDGTLLSMTYCLIMGVGVVLVILFSIVETDKPEAY